MEEKRITFAENGRPLGLRTWIEVDREAIKNNFALVKARTANSKIIAVAKSNAYGHGLFEFSKNVLEAGADWIGVDSVVEALALRERGIAAPMLVMGYVLPERLEDASAHDIAITISSFEGLYAAKVVDKPLRVHIKIDTGLGRQGFLAEEIDELLKKLSTIAEHKKIIIEGLYTHFADAKDRAGEAYSLKQIAIFEEVNRKFVEAGYTPLTHIHASPGLLRYFGKIPGDMVRIGALLYGIWPKPAMKEEFGKEFAELKPILSWKAIISEVKKMPKGASVGYGRSSVLTRESKIAISPIGYWHGYPGALSSKGEVLVEYKQGGKMVSALAPVLGRISMDMIALDVTDIPEVAVLDVVTLISNDSESAVSAEKVASLAGLSVHELLTRLNPKIERIYR